MARKNEILEEQRKARKQFLELKKMQQGIADAPLKPSEDTVSPRTFGQKLSNFWTYYKLHVISVIAVAVIIAVSVNQCVNSVKPDMNVAVFLYQTTSSEQLKPLCDYMEEKCEDINGDGQVYINIINCSYSPEDNNGQYEMTALNKLQATLAADYDTLLYITDAQSYNYFLQSDAFDGLFTDEPYKLSENLISRLSTDDLPFVYKDLQISCRSFYNTALEKDKNAKPVYEQSQKILEAIKSE